jgi:hypothetical protein
MKLRQQQQQHPVVSAVLIVATLFRLSIIVGIPLPQDDVYWRLFYSPWLQSTLVRPNHLLEHVTEATAVQQLFVSSKPFIGFADAYRIQDHIQLPPLILAFWQELLRLFGRNQSSQHVFMSFLLLGVDVGIAVLMYMIGRQLVQLEQEDPWEETVQQQMHKSIQPPSETYFTVKEQCTDNNNNNKVITNESTTDQQVEEPDLLVPSPSLSRDNLNTCLALLYYASPISILCSGVYVSFQNVWVLFLLCAVYTSCRPNGSTSLAALYLAIVTYAEVHYVIFVIPCAIWIYRRTNKGNTSDCNRRTVTCKHERETEPVQVDPFVLTLTSSC